MSEVAVVAAITGGASVLTSGITGAVTWAVSKNSASTERAKVEAENQRLRHEHREEERRNRQNTYHQFIDAFMLVFQTLGTKAPRDMWKERCDNFIHLLSGVLIFGPTSVRNGAYEINEVYRKIWPALSKERADHPEKPEEEHWRDATAPLKEEFSIKGSNLVPLMHADVTRGIVEDPD